MKKIGVLNYGLGNIRSFLNTLDHLDINYSLISKPIELDKIDILIIVGVGSFKSSIEKIKNKKFFEPLKKFKNKNKFILGICVGMQILMEKGTENGNINGLGFIKGKVIKMKFEKNFPLPHIGWNEISNYTKNFDLFENIDLGSSFYFIHSYTVKLEENDLQIAQTKYGSNLIISAFRKNNVFGVQFHPEKSQEIGIKLIQNFFKIANA